jgi:hypothetical protein
MMGTALRQQPVPRHHGGESAMRVNGTVPCTCLQCRRTFLVWPRTVRRGWGKFCSQRCKLRFENEQRFVRHGEARKGAKTVEYRVWRGIKDRCLYPLRRGYAGYGGRGIGVCPEWARSFETFLRDVGRRPGPGYSLDRIDNDQGYRPGNVRWATRSEQARNTRANRVLVVRGNSRLLVEWAETSGIDATTIFRRLKVGWPVECAVRVLPGTVDRV